jgi:serine protease Do
MTCFLAALFFRCAGPARSEEMPPDLRASVEEAVARVKPALVRIHVVSTDYNEGREMKYESSGSGVIITSQGHIVTNHHVAGHAARALCTLATKEEIEADLVGADPLTDIAVIQLKSDGTRTFPVAAFGDSNKANVGDTVLAMGSPMALSQSVTLGIVSNTEVIMPEWLRAWGDLKEDGEDVGALVKWIGHDAAIAGGNSGGPLVNLAGEIIGINELWLGLGGAIPGNLVKGVVDQIVANGKVRRAWLGLTVQPRPKHAQQKEGILISGVLSHSPAAAAGFRSGDMLLRLNGVPVNVRFAEELPAFNRLVAGLPIGGEVEAIVLRDGAETPIKVTPVERELAKPKERELKSWGITASDVSFIIARELKRKNQDGVLVTSVRPGGGAGEAKPAVAAMDVIVEIAGKPVKNLREFIEVTDQLLAGKTDLVPALVAFDRETERCLTVVKVGIKDVEDPGLEVKKAWLPCKTQVVTRNIAELLGRPDLTGVRVTQVYPGSTAEKAGIQVGDLILAVEDQKLTASAPENYEELPALIRQYKVGDTVKLAILRGAQELTIPVALVRAPKLDREMKQHRDENFEFTVRDISFFDKAREQWPEDQAGVMVSGVTPGGWAALGRLKVGDLILSMDEKPVTDVVAFEQQMDAVAAAKPASVALKLLRGIYTVFVELEPKWNNK